jgi:hypothetical protein
MKRIATACSIGIAALMLAAAAPAFAHDMASMSAMGSDGAPNAMGGHMDMGAHMTMTPQRPETPDDVARARVILETLRTALQPYRDYHVALRKGMRIFLPSVPQEVYHFTDYATANAEYQGRFDPAHPGSLLYVRQGSDYVLVGAMYSAPPDYTYAQLDELIPLSVCRWHAHTNICLPEGITLEDLLRGDVGADRASLPGMLPIAANPEALELNHKLGFLADGRFGFHGKIADAASCGAAGGHFLPQAFGWMVHVYPFNGDDLKVAYGLSVPKPPAN